MAEGVPKSWTPEGVPRKIGTLSLSLAERERMARWNRALAAGIVAEGCAYCAAHWLGIMPSHTASLRCQSGKRPHCTCDTCF